MNALTAPYLYQEELYHIPPIVTVVLRSPWHVYSAEQRILLSKILASVKLNLASVQIVTTEKFDLKNIPSDSTGLVLIFGSSTDGIIPYQMNQAQGFMIIKADDLSELDDQKKKNLWIALKAMFGL